MSNKNTIIEDFIQTNSTQDIQENIENSMDARLFALFDDVSVPDNINISLKNKIYYEASCGKRKIDLWWMPAVINTAIGLAGLIFSFLLYFMIRIGGSHTIIPNIINHLSVLSLKLVIIIACADIILGWLSTAIIIPIASGHTISKGIKAL